MFNFERQRETEHKQGRSNERERETDRQTDRHRI